MNQSDNMLETVIKQAKHIFPSMKDLKKVASKKGKQRGELIEKCTANVHSFNVYTYASSTFQNSSEAQTFKQNINNWLNEFNGARFDIDGDVNEKKVRKLYDEVVSSYNVMVEALGFEQEKIKG